MAFPQTPANPSAQSGSTGAVLSTGQIFAVLVGVGAYVDLPELDKAAGDAAGMLRLLTEAGVPRRNIKVLQDEAATRQAISDALDTTAHKVGPDDYFIFFFSGHGMHRRGGFDPGEYLCPIDLQRSSAALTGISSSDLTQALAAFRGRRVLALLDACHSGGVGQAETAWLQWQPGLSEAAYQELAGGQGRVVLASSLAAEESFEQPGLENSAFTHCLLTGLRGAAAGKDGVVRILGLFQYLAREVPKLARQHPLFKGTLDQDWPVLGGALAEGVPAVSPLDSGGVASPVVLDQSNAIPKSDRMPVQDETPAAQPAVQPVFPEPRPSTQQQVPPRFVDWTLPQKNSVVTLLLACPSISDHDRREAVVSELPLNIRDNITRSDIGRLDALAIFSTCAQYPAGVQTLLSVIEFFDGGSLPFQALQDKLRELGIV